MVIYVDIQKEKEYIYSIMREVSKERRELTKIYFGLKERLDDLMKLERLGIENISATGYVNLRNNIDKETMIENIKRETSQAIQNIENENYGLTNSEAMRKENIASKIKEEIQAEKNSSKVKVKKLSTEAITGIVSNILKEFGTPMELSKIHKELNDRIDYNITMKNFSNNIIYRVMKNTNRVERVSRGFYQYRQ